MVNGLSLLFVLYSLSAYLWPGLRHSRVIARPISVFGRHSLLVFVMHAYFAYVIGALYNIFDSLTVSWFCIVISLIVMYKVSYAREHVNACYEKCRLESVG